MDQNLNSFVPAVAGVVCIVLFGALSAKLFDKFLGMIKDKLMSRIISVVALLFPHIVVAVAANTFKLFQADFGWVLVGLGQFLYLVRMRWNQQKTP